MALHGCIVIYGTAQVELRYHSRNRWQFVRIPYRCKRLWTADCPRIFHERFYPGLFCDASRAPTRKVSARSVDFRRILSRKRTSANTHPGTILVTHNLPSGCSALCQTTTEGKNASWVN